MTEFKVRALSDFSNTPGSQYQPRLDNGQIVVQQADGILITRRPDGSQRQTPLYSRDDLQSAASRAAALAVAPIDNLVRGKAAAGTNADITGLLGLPTPSMFPSRAAAMAAPGVGAGVTLFRTDGYAASGDGGGGLYSRLASVPSPVKPWHIQVGTAWFTLLTNSVNPEQVGGGRGGDDSAALQACHDYPAARFIETGNKVYNLGRDGLRGSGSKIWRGSGTIIKQSAPPTRDMVLYLNVADFKISGVRFDGNGMLGAPGGSYPNFLPCLYIGACTDFDVTDCRAVGFKTCGLLFNVVVNGTIDKCTAIQSNPTGVYANYGIAVVGGVGSISSNIHIDKCTCIGCDIAVNMADSWVSDNNISGWGFSAGINVAAAPSCYGLTIVGNHCYDCLRVPDRDNYFMDGIECWAPDSTVANNHCYRCLGSGIGWGSRRGLCSGNTLYDNGGDTTGPWQGILALYQDTTFSAEDSFIEGNVAYDTRGAGVKTQTYGYREKPGASFNNIKIGVNHFHDLGISPYATNGTLVNGQSSSSWTPASAGPAFTSASGSYSRNGNLANITLDVTVPITASTTNFAIDGLPVPATAFSALNLAFSAGGTPPSGFGGNISPGSGRLAFFKNNGAANCTFADVSGLRLVISATYQISG